MMKKTMLRMLSAALLTLFTGCCSIDYVGRSFDQHPEGAPILFTWEKTEVDPAQYTIIGHALLSVPGDADRYEIEDKLTEEARKRGADAVCVTATRRVNEGVYDLNEDELTFPQDNNNNLQKVLQGPVNVQLSQEEEKKWGKPDRLQGERHGRSLIKVRAVFWKERAIAEPLIRRQNELLESKAAGNWNGEKDPDAPKKAPAPELPPLPSPEASTPALPAPSSETASRPHPNMKDPADSSPAAPLLQGPNPPSAPQFALPPSDIVAMP